MVLMYARVNRPIPNRHPPDLILTPIPFDYQQIALEHQQFVEFLLLHADVFHFVQPKFVGIYVCDPQIRELRLERDPLRVLRQSANYFPQ